MSATFEKDLLVIRRVLRKQYVFVVSFVLCAALYAGFSENGWLGALKFGGGALIAISVVMWLMRLRAEEGLKKSEIIQ